MKIFPLRPLSTYDRMRNLFNIMSKNDEQFVSIIRKKEEPCGVKVDFDMEHYKEVMYWRDLIGKYRLSVYELVKNIKG